MIDIEKIVKLAECGYSLDFEFGKFSKVYMHTTENIKDFLSCFDLNKKRVLTVAGSGDQLLNAYALGATLVDTFDINPLAKCAVDLKISALKCLSYEEFIHFFFSNFPEFFSEGLYAKIYPLLNQDTKVLFDTFFQKFGVKDSIKKLYYQMNPSLKKMKQMNLYLEEYYYYVLKENLKNKGVNFIESSIQDLRANITTSYDMMLFSNISDSINSIYTDDALKNYLRLIHSLTKKLNKDGVIETGYIYGNYPSVKSRSDFTIDSKREKYFMIDEFSKMAVNPYTDHSSLDHIIYYIKKK